VAGTFTIPWYAVDTGGGFTMTGSGPGGAVEILGTLGQPSISGPMLGGSPPTDFEIVGGFLTAALPGDQIWVGGSSGSFTDAFNWDDGIVPGPLDNVIFDVNTSLMNIAINSDIEFGRLYVLDSIVRFNFFNTDCTLNSPSTTVPSLIIARDNDMAELRLENFSTGDGFHGLSANSASIGDGVLSDGTLLVTGPDTIFWCDGEFTIGMRGMGLLRVEDGARTQSTGPVWIGRHAGSEGRVVLDGAGTTWETSSLALNDDFIVGESGTGILEIRNGATLTTWTEDEVTLGVNPGSYGQVIISGVGSAWIELNASILTIGDIDSGLVTLQNQGTLEFNNDNPASVIVVGPAGELEGAGIVDGNVISLGGVAPGRVTVEKGLARPAGPGPATTGTLSVLGHYEQIQTSGGGGEDDTGNLFVRVIDPPSGPIDSDRLEVGGTAKLGGGLFVTVDASVTDPAAIPALPMLTAASISTADSGFDVAVLPGLEHPYFMQVGYDAGGPAGDVVTISIGELNQELAFGLPGGLQLPSTPVDGFTGDFDGDGDTDLAIGLPGNPGSIRTLRNNGNGSFPIPMQDNEEGGNGVAALTGGDFDGDGDIDLAVVNSGDDNVEIFVNQGVDPVDGYFIFTAGMTFNVGDAPSDIAAARLSGDTLLDLVVTNEGSSSVNVLTQTPGGGADFSVSAPVSTAGEAPSPRKVAVGRMDTPSGSPGAIDVVVLSTAAGRVGVLRNSGTGTFGTPGTVHSFAVDEGPNHVVVGDMNFDGLDDVVTTNETPGDTAADSISVLANRWVETGALAPSVNVPAALGARSAVLADLDGDSATDLDLAALTGQGTGSTAQVYRNDSEGADGSVAVTLAQEIALGVNAIAILAAEIDGEAGTDLITINVGGAGPGGGEELTFVPNTTAPPCPADCAAGGNGQVNVTDLLALLAQWNLVGSCDIAPPGGNGVVNVSDLLALLAAWGACP
jgi:T5SS/PEP-CTERM-associated repeat protein